MENYLSEVKRVMSLLTHTVTVVEEHNSMFLNGLLRWVLEWIAKQQQELHNFDAADEDQQWYAAIRYNLKAICNSAAQLLQLLEGKEMKSIPAAIPNRDILGEGGFGVVVEVKHNEKRAAKKTIKATVWKFAQALAFYKDELKAWKAVSAGKEIITLHGFGLDVVNHELVFLCELASRSLRHALVEKPKLEKSAVNVKGIGMDIARGLQYMHGKGFVHADVKPTNVLLFITDRQTPVAKLADFGISKELGSAGVEQSYGIGYRGYVSPEVDGYSLISIASDIFAFGMTLLDLVDIQMNGKNLEEATRSYYFEHDIEIPLCNVLPDVLNLMKGCLNEDFSKRPTAKECIEVLQKSRIYNEVPPVSRSHVRRVANVERTDVPRSTRSAGLLATLGEVSRGIAGVSRQMLANCSNRFAVEA